MIVNQNLLPKNEVSGRRKMGSLRIMNNILPVMTAGLNAFYMFCTRETISSLPSSLSSNLIFPSRASHPSAA